MYLKQVGIYSYHYLHVPRNGNIIFISPAHEHAPGRHESPKLGQAGILALTILIFLLALSTAQAATYTCDSCTQCNQYMESGNTTMQSGDVLQLSQDLTTSSYCIDLQGRDDITLDCNEKKITGGGGGTTYTGINSTVTHGANNSIIKNCANISYFTYGIYIRYTNNITIQNTSLFLNTPGAGYGLYLRDSQNCTLADITTNSNSQNGITMTSSSNNTLTNITAKSNIAYGLSLSSSSNNIISNVNASGPTQQSGFYLTSNSNNNTFQNITTRYNSLYGISLSASSYNTLDDITASPNSVGSGLYLTGSANYNNITNANTSNCLTGTNIVTSSGNFLSNITSNSNSQTGFLFQTSSNNTLTNITAISNSQRGLYLDSGSNYNTVTNATLRENTLWDVYMDVSTDLQCSNTISNSTGSGNRPIMYFNSSMNLSDETLSELVLCNADNSNITNVTIIGSASIKNNGVLVHRTDYSNFTRINSSYRYYGFYLLTVSNYNTFTNITANSNSQNGITMTSSSNNTLADITTNSNSQNGITMTSSSNNTLTNITAKSNIAYGLSLSSSSNNIISNVNASGPSQQSGFYLASNSNNNTLTNITASYNSLYGLSLSGSSYNTLVDITASLNSVGSGLYFTGSANYNNITNANTSNCLTGTNIVSSSGNFLSNITSNFNSQSGFLFQTSSNNTLTNITASHNLQRGIQIYYSSNYNTINNSRIESNTIYGIYLQTSGTNYPKYNTLYNNYLNNTVNLYSDNVNNTNYWNTTLSCTSGTNIIGGPCIGGNYWTDPVGGNFSDGCTDADNDGICDSNYIAQVNNSDYLPLAENPPQPYFVSPTLANQSYTQNESWIFVNVSANETLSSCLLDWNNGTWTNISMTLGGMYCYLNMTDLINNTAYYFRVYATDSQSKINVTEDRQITVNLTSSDTTPPDLAWSTDLESNNSLTTANKTWLYWNFTSSETIGTDGCIVEINSTNQTGAIDGLSCYYNETSLTGNVTRCAYGWANDTSNNWNLTEYRCISTNEQQPDTTPPDLWFTSPSSNVSTTSNNWIFVNVSADETLSWCTLDWYNGTWTNVSMDATGKYCYVNMTSLAAGNYSFMVYGNDTAGNMNVTEFRQARVFKGSCNNCTDCNQEIAATSSGETVQLSQDLTTTGSCIDLQGKDNIILDCNGKTITGSNSGSAYTGINSTVADSANNSIIKNCANISYFTYGIYILYTSNITIQNSSMFLNSKPGLGIGYGLYLINSQNSLIWQVNASQNEGGLYLESSNNNTLQNITTNSNSQYGLYLSSSSNNTLQNITANSNVDGLYLISSSNNTLTNITALSNTYGLYLSSSSNNTLRNTAITTTGNQAGLYAEGSPSYRNDIDNTLTVDGKPVQYFDGNYKPCPNNQILDYNETYSQVDFIGCNNVTLYATIITDSIYIWSANNSKIYNVNSSYNTYGIYLMNSNNTILQNITANSNVDGLYLSYSNNNTLQDITANYTNLGLWFMFSNNNTLTNITANSNSQYGLYLSTSSNNTLQDITSNNNSYYGLYLVSSNNNTFTNITANSNSQYGILIQWNSYYNNLTHSTLTNNTLAGIFLDENGALEPEYNRIWNNYLNNTVNILIDSGITNPNYFNTTLSCTSGPNIIGGPCIGGNYYTDPDGNYSDTCTDSDNNGICDQQYNITNLYTWSRDYLPLAEDPPQLRFVSPSSNNSVTSNNWIFVNVTANESLSWCTLNWNGVNQTMTATGQYCYRNMTGLTSGSYYFRVYGNDSTNHMNVTEDRQIRMFKGNCSSCTECNQEIAAANSGETVTILSDLSINGHCINMSGKDNVTLDCNGKKMQGNNSWGYYGIFSDSADGANNSTIKNCANISYFDFGIYIAYSNNVTIYNTSVFRNNQLNGFGLYLAVSKNCNLIDINTSQTKRGIYLLGSTNNTLTNINVSGNQEYGIVIQGDGYNILNNITANYNSQGILLWGSSNNNMTSITTNYNSMTGISINMGSDNNTLQNITANSNSQQGLYLDGSNNTLRNVTITTTSNNAGLYTYASLSNRNDIDNTVTVDGKPVQYFDGYYKPCPDNQILDYNNTYSQVAFIGCNNVTLNATEIIDSVYLFSTSNSRIYNVNSSYNYYGLYLSSSNNNTLQNITANSNSQYGLYLSSSSNNTLQNIIANSNTGGLSLESNSNNNTLQNIIANSNTGGLSLTSSSNNTLTNIAVNSNSNIGLSLTSSSSNTLQNITANSNSPYGLGLSYSSNYNIINNSRIENNTQYGIYLDDFYTLGIVHYNTFYNNYLNNTVNLGSNNANNLNYWNTTLNCSASPNIIGGPCIGGNYWTNYSATGFSDTCTDSNNDGICDSPSSYTPQTNNIDYLPLAEDPPQLRYLSPSSNNSVTSNNWVFVNVTANESLSWCTLNWYNGSWQNVSMAVTGFYCYVNMTSLTSGSYYFRVYGNDSTNHMNVTEDRQITLQGLTYTCNSCSDCNAKIASANSGDTIQLITPISNQAGNCINFGGKDNLFFDCLGNTIDGVGSNYGIYLNSSTGGSNNNTIRNCVVTDFQKAIFLDSSSSNTLQNITANNSGAGIDLESSSNNILINITANSNYQGLYQFQGSNNNYSNIDANFNNYGLYLYYYVTSNTFTNVVANSNSNKGFYLWSDCNNNRFINITANSNMYGFYAEEYISNNTLRNSSFQNNTYNFEIYTEYGIRDLYQDIDTSNTVENKPIYYWVNRTSGEINSSSNAGIVYLINCTNITVRDLNVSYRNYRGIILYATNSIITNVTSNNNFYGLSIHSSYNNTFTNITANFNSDSGFYFYSNANNNTLQNIIANSNSWSGIFLFASSNNTLKNITANYNVYGLLFQVSSNYNTINSSRIENNTQSGIYLAKYFSYPLYNTFYNNYLNNTVNLYSDNASNLNYWNTTLSCNSGPNIIGGPCIGGNYWTDPVGGNFSDGCTDADNDGICDSSYPAQTNNTDYLPLAENPPQLHYLSPASNNSMTSNNWVFVNVSANETLSWCTLNWYNGTWTNVSMTVVGQYCFRNMTGLTTGSYYFRVYGNDSTNHMNVTGDRQITVDITPPDLTWSSLLESNNSLTTANKTWLYWNFTSSETIGTDGCIVEINGTNQTGEIDGLNCYLNETGLTGNVTRCATGWANDTANNWNLTEYRCISTNEQQPDTPPDLWFTSPVTNGSTNNNNWIFVNVSATETLNTCILNWNGANQTITPTGSYCSVNKTGLTSGSYYFRMYANDSTGNMNVTEDRQARVFKESCNNCTDCNQEIAAANSGDTIQLSQDLTTTGDCIDLQGKDNITLDCNGKKITGPNSGTTYTGINSTVADGANNSIIKNCANISYFTYGIYIRYTNNITIQNSSLFLNTQGYQYALYLRDSQSSQIIEVNSSQNYYGLYLWSSSNNTLTNITANYNSFFGLYLPGSNNNTFTNIITNSNSQYGFALSSSSDNTLTNITANYNSMSGFALSSSSNNNFTNITANYNSGSGLDLQSSTNNTLRNMTIITTSNNPGLYTLGSPSFRNDIDNTVAVDGKPVQYFDGYYKPCPDNQLLDYNNTYSQVAFIGCNNVTLYATEITDSVYLFYTNNSRIYNVNSSYNKWGFFLDSSSNNTLTNITVKYNSNEGIYLLSSSNNILTNITVNSNSMDGLYLSSSNNNTLQNITANSNYHGLYLYMSSNNTINNSRIQSNTEYGIYLSGINPYSRYNTFYNNYLNNTVNLYSDNANNLNYWNTTLSCTSGPNIIGGPCIGGNYWSNFTAKFSDTCTDSNWDGICDSPSSYAPATNNVDYLPLSEKAPQLRFLSPASNNSVSSNNWIFVNVTANETLSWCTLNWYNGTWQNVSMTATGQYCYRNMTELSSGSYYFRVYGNDSTNHLNSTEYRQIYVDTQPPYWSSNSTNTQSTYSPSQQSCLNITWQDTTSGVSTVFIQGNWSGSDQNYTASNSSNTEFYYCEIIPAGTFYWKSWANDTNGLLNYTDTWIFTIQKTQNPILLFLNSSQQNLTVSFGETSNASAYIQFGSVSLFRNNSAVSNPEIESLAAGYYIYLANSSGDSNHTINSTYFSVTINQIPSTTSLFLNSSEDNLTITYTQSVNATAYCDYGSPTLYLNSSAASNPFISNLGAGYWNFTGICSGDSNHSVSSKSFFLTINQAQTYISLIISPSSPTVYGTPITATCQANNTEVTANLYRNSSLINSENSIPVTLAAATYNFTCNSSATGNYTASYNQSLHEITRAPMPIFLYLNSSSTNQTYSYGETTNATGYKSYSEGSLTLLRNDTDYGNPEIENLPAGYWNYTLYFTQTENYTSNSTVLFATVSSGSSVTTVYLNGSTNDQSINFGETVNATAYTNYGSITFHLNSSVISNPYLDNLAAGYYNFTAYSSGDANHSASEDTAFLTVNQIPSTTSLHLNSSESNLTITYGQTVNATAYCDYGSAQLILNNTVISNPYIESLAAGYYNFTANCSGDSNHSSSSKQFFLTVNQASNPISLHLNSSQSNLTVSFGETSNASAYIQFGSISLFRNNTPVSNPEISELEAGYYIYLANSSGDSNHTSNSTYLSLTVTSGASIVSLYLNESQSDMEQTFGDSVNVTVSCDFGSFVLHMNSSEISSPFQVVLGAGYYNFSAFCSGDANHSASQKTYFLTVNKASTAIYLFVSPASPSTYGTLVTATCYADNLEITSNLYRNGTMINSENGTVVSLAAGTYGYVCNCSATGNYTFAENSSIHHVTRVSMPLYLFLNMSQADQFYAYGETTNATGYKGYAEGTIALYRNGTEVSNPEISVIPAGYWNYTLAFNQTENYTAAGSIMLYATVTEGASSTVIELNDSSGDLTINYTETVNASAWTNFGTLTFLLNGSSIGNPFIAELAAGFWNFSAYSCGDGNHTPSQDTAFLTVNRIPANATLLLNGSASDLSQVYLDSVNASAYCDFGAASILLNGSVVSNPFEAALPVGCWNLTGECSGDLNHSVSQITHYLNVNKASTNLTLLINGTDGDFVAEKGSQVNITAYLNHSQSPTIYLYQNGSLAGSGPSPFGNISYYQDIGIYNITASYPGSQNYTSAEAYHMLNVTDTIPPDLIFVPPTLANSSNTSRSWIFVNVSANENLNACLLEWNITNLSMQASGRNCYANMTNLTDGNYYFRVWGNDSSGNLNMTGYLQITVNLSLDEDPPQLMFVPPTLGNQSTTANSWINVNVSANENLSSCLLDWYNGTWTNVSMAVAGDYCYISMQSLSQGYYYFRVYANDTSGNLNVTEDRKITYYVYQPPAEPPSGGGGGGGGGPPAPVNKTNISQALGFIESPRSIYMELYNGDRTRVNVFVRNTLNSSQTLSGYLTSELRDIVSFESTSAIYLGSGYGGEIILTVNVPEQVKPGNYSGYLRVSAGQLTDSIPVTIKVLEVKKGLLDLKIALLEPTVFPGKNEHVKVSLYNLGRTERVDVQLKLQIIDSNGTVVSEKEEAMAIDTSLSSIIAVEVHEGTAEGRYTIKATAYYTNLQNETVEVTASDELTVMKLQEAIGLETTILGVKIWYLVVISIPSVVIAIIYYRRRKKFKNKVKQCKEETSDFVRKIEELKKMQVPEEKFKLTSSRKNAEMLSGLKEDLSAISKALESMNEKSMETGNLEKELSDIRRKLDTEEILDEKALKNMQKRYANLMNEMQKETEKFEKSRAKREKEQAEKNRKEMEAARKEHKESLEKVRKEIQKLEREQAKREKEDTRKEKEAEESEHLARKPQEEKELYRRAEEARERFEKIQEKNHKEAVERALKKRENLDKTQTSWEKELSDRIQKQNASLEAMKHKEPEKSKAPWKKFEESSISKKEKQEKVLDKQILKQSIRPAPAIAKKPKAEERQEGRQEPAAIITRESQLKPIPKAEKADEILEKAEKKEIRIEYEEPKKAFAYDISGRAERREKPEEKDEILKMKVQPVLPPDIRRDIEVLRRNAENFGLRLSLLEQSGVDVRPLYKELDGLKSMLHFGYPLNEKVLNNAKAKADNISKRIDALEKQTREESPAEQKIQHQKNMPAIHEETLADPKEIKALKEEFNALKKELEPFKERTDTVLMEVKLAQIESTLQFTKNISHQEAEQTSQQIFRLKKDIEKFKIRIESEKLVKDTARLEEELIQLRKSEDTGRIQREILAIRKLLGKEITLDDIYRLRKRVERIRAEVEEISKKP